MTQRSSSTRVLSIMQELQQLRENVYIYSEKNRELAKALTITKQELTKARAAQSTAFSDRVVEWMETRRKPAGMQHQAVQCSFEELDPSCKSKNSEFKSIQSWNQNCEVIGTQKSSSTAFVPMVNESKTHSDRNGAIAIVSKEDEAKGVIAPHNFRANATLVPSRSSRTGQQRRLRQRNNSISYVEPKLNTKLRRGDYYGLGKRTGRPIHWPAQSVMDSGPYCTESAFGHKRSPFRSRRTMRSVKRISYEEPKLSTKLRQGDKFTFNF